MGEIQDKELQEMMAHSNRIHAVSHKFQEFLEKEFGEYYHKELVGYECQLKIEEYVADNPEIVIVRCDDSYFASSILVIVPHLEMGNSIYFIPQCTTTQNEFFLYPNHQRMLIEALTKMNHEKS